jgi:hypothetical protein
VSATHPSASKLWALLHLLLHHSGLKHCTQIGWNKSWHILNFRDRFCNSSSTIQHQQDEFRKLGTATHHTCHIATTQFTNNSICKKLVCSTQLLNYSQQFYDV